MYQLGSSHQLPVDAVLLLKYNQETVDHHYNDREGNMPATTCRNCCETSVNLHQCNDLLTFPVRLLMGSLG